jgi:hypothetical protein
MDHYGFTNEVLLMLPSIVVAIGVNDSTTVNHVPPATCSLNVPFMSFLFSSNIHGA